MIRALTGLALALAVIGVASAQTFYGARDPEVRAAQQAIGDAVAHLQRVRQPQNRTNLRALELLALAQHELEAEVNLGSFNNLPPPAPGPRQ
jgi:hypothetical protein